MKRFSRIVGLVTLSWIVFPQMPATAVEIRTLSGVVYKNATITRVEADGIVITHTFGVTKVPFTDLSEALQRRYHYDPQRAAAFQATEAEAKQRAEAHSLTNPGPPTVLESTERAFESMRVGNVDEAYSALGTVIQAGSGDILYAEIADHLRNLIQAIRNRRSVLQNGRNVAEEADRLRRNADVADRPNVLFPKDHSNQVRAEEMRRNAEGLLQNEQREIANLSAAIGNELRSFDVLVTKAKAAGMFSLALDLGEMQNNVASHYLPKANFRSAIDERERTELQGHVAAASEAKARGTRALTEKRGWEAHEEIARGLREEPGNRQLQAMAANVQKLLGDCQVINREARKLQAAKQYEEALRKLSEARQQCVDYPDVERLARELNRIVADKEQRLAKAKSRKTRVITYRH